jgi:Flp pilus assembly protein TadB
MTDDEIKLLLQQEANLRERGELHDERAAAFEAKLAAGFDVMIGELRAGIRLPEAMRTQTLDLLDQAPASLAAKVAELRALLEQSGGDPE